MKKIDLRNQYFCIFPIIVGVAEAHGYGLAIHGTNHGFYDLVAFPWSVNVSDPLTFIEAIERRCNERYGTFQIGRVGPIEKEHGRLVWCLNIGSGIEIDISVFPAK